jgi:hypothetical protein
MFEEVQSHVASRVGWARTMVVMFVIDLAEVECVGRALACSMRAVVCVCGGERAGRI